MVLQSRYLICTLLIVFFQIQVPCMADDKVIIAHRGASGYLMEHNLPSTVLAIAMGADYVEQDLVMTKDDRLIVYHDLTLERLTDVADKFQDRQREDGRFYVIDFTLEEIKQLTLKETQTGVTDGESTEGSTGFPTNLGNPGLTIPTFEEQLVVIRGLEKTLKKTIGIYPEIKKVWFHKSHGKDITMAVLKILHRFGYTQKEDKLFLQCFDHGELKRIRDDLFPMMGMEIKLIQLIDLNDGEETMIEQGSRQIPYNYDWMFSGFGLRALSLIVDGIGLNQSMLIDETGVVIRPDYINKTKKIGLAVHVYTLRNDPVEFPQPITNFSELIELFLFTIGVDGIFTDHCSEAVDYLKTREETDNQQNEIQNTVTGEQHVIQGGPFGQLDNLQSPASVSDDQTTTTPPPSIE